MHIYIRSRYAVCSARKSVAGLLILLLYSPLLAVPQWGKIYVGKKKKRWRGELRILYTEGVREEKKHYRFECTTEIWGMYNNNRKRRVYYSAASLLPWLISLWWLDATRRVHFPFSYYVRCLHLSSPVHSPPPFKKKHINICPYNARRGGDK